MVYGAVPPLIVTVAVNPFTTVTEFGVATNPPNTASPIFDLAYTVVTFTESSFAVIDRVLLLFDKTYVNDPVIVVSFPVGGHFPVCVYVPVPPEATIFIVNNFADADVSTAIFPAYDVRERPVPSLAI